ncbi:MAG: penicillin acylase family protein [Desulfohalobiaceae bacterium]|nr:penicillin acylase family protein [Desulfohalobiaceae bacterium]
MRLKNDPMTLKGPAGGIRLERNSRGVPCITAGNYEDLAFGHGFVHASDRQLQVLLTRLAYQGRLSECLTAHPELIAMDKKARRINFLPDPENQIARLDPELKKQLTAYVDGFNYFLTQNRPVFELRLLGYRPEPLRIEDVISLAKVMGFVGLAESQANMEKLILQMVQEGVDEERIRELFPYLRDDIDYNLLKKVSLVEPVVPDSLTWIGLLPRISASNAWAVSGELTVSGLPLLCNDPHLEVNRLPSIWQEVVLRIPGKTIKGAAFPGAPGVLIGRSDDLAFGVTYAFMDMIDYNIEHCRNGCYRRGENWVPFSRRREKIRLKKGRTEEAVFYENDLGVLEGDPYEEGYYLVMSWAAARGCGGSDFSYLQIPEAKDVPEAMTLYRQMQSGGWCFVLADVRGNIGLQMSGRLFKRVDKASGLLPQPAWEEGIAGPEFVDPKELPAVLNPESGFIVSANHDLNHLGPADPINLPVADHRARRITSMLKQSPPLDIAFMQTMQNDLFSLQAERLLPIITPLLPETKEAEILRAWDYSYAPQSRGAALFERIYREILLTVFGDNGLGREVMDYLLTETALLCYYFGNFDQVLLHPDSTWFREKDQEELLQQAVARGLSADVPEYGQTRRVTISHLLFGGKLPGWFGFDRGPIQLPGGRATILQGQICRTMNRTTTFGPSYRMVVDLGTQALFSNLPGGVSDRRFSRLYCNNMQNWLKGEYQEL